MQAQWQAVRGFSCVPRQRFGGACCPAWRSTVLNCDKAYAGAGVRGELESEKAQQWIVIVCQFSEEGSRFGALQIL